ncbi:unnamed protein product [Arctia plantaginis]|uniref:Carboxylic ester hydrolase n=1 Tax=Arctia plantaginis TaxID=874455 RepID=A0A8S1AMK0_ARCPL|nr:unnamed protein product [Arctia plantaginis]
MVRVNVSEGLLEGEVVQNEYGGTFYSFKGIPYAQPPVGNLRFKAPQPPTPWKGVRNAKSFQSKCFQYNIIYKAEDGGSEDCLYLNVNTPNIKPEKLLPVMFWIHGGAFICGCGDDEFYGPEYLLKQGVIVVTFNYRVGLLGFLCLHTEDVPGNAGMKDQVAALRWVNKNISNFGGDPENITIFGESAGGVSVSYHLLSPMSKGLFRRAIVQSGSAFCAWARAYKPRERALALARQLGCYSENDQELYDFFKNQPRESLLAISVPILFSEKVNLDFVHFSVVEEKVNKNNEIFFAGDCTSVLEGVEIIIGYTADEGWFGVSHAGDPKTKLQIAREFPETFVPKSLAVNLTVNQILELGIKIRKFYFKDIVDDFENMEQLVKFYSMKIFVHGTILFAKLCAKKNKVFLYKFSCKSERNIYKDLLGVTEWVGNKSIICHGDDLLYFFNVKAFPFNPNTYQLIKKVVTLWTNFAKYGNPTPDESQVQWKYYTEEKQDYLEIGNEFVPGTAPDEDELKFWDSIYEESGQKPY